MDTDQALLDGEVDEESSTEPEEQQAEADPQADIAARLTGLEAEITRLKALDPSKIGPAIGRVAALQSQLDAIKDRNPSADLDPRIAANENLTVTLAQALANSDLVDDRFKQTLTAALLGIDQARTERQQRQLEASLEEKITKKLTLEAPSQASANDPWDEATETVKELATELGVEATAIPWAEIQAKANGSPLRAVSVATKWLKDNQTDPTTQRVAARQQAAGNGSPKPGGPAGSLEQDKARIMERGIPITDTAARKRIAEDLGVTL